MNEGAVTMETISAQNERRIKNYFVVAIVSETSAAEIHECGAAA